MTGRSDPERDAIWERAGQRLLAADIHTPEGRREALKAHRDARQEERRLRRERLISANRTRDHASRAPAGDSAEDAARTGDAEAGRDT